MFSRVATETCDATHAGEKYYTVRFPEGIRQALRKHTFLTPHKSLREGKQREHRRKQCLENEREKEIERIRVKTEGQILKGFEVSQH